MGFLATTTKVVFARFVPAILLLLAILLGWLNLDPVNPEGRFFATIIPLLKGKLPPTIVGHGKMTGTPPVPDDMLPQPRPANEAFASLITENANVTYPMPLTGLGMCCRPTAYDDVLVERSVLWYLLLGGRLIDGAHLYLNHKAIGKGLQAAMARGVPRREIFFTTKVFPSHYGYNTTMQVVPQFLKETQLDYLDLVLMHAPVRFPPNIPGLKNMASSQECSDLKLSHTECRQETYKALSELRRQGIIQNVGVSNFAKSHLQELQQLQDDDGVAPITNNQIQFNPWLLDEWVETVEYCHQHKIVITGYNSLGGSLQHHETATIDTLTQLAQQHDKSVAQIMLRWAMQKQAVVIPGTGNPTYMKENLAIYDFTLSEQDVAAIDALRTAEEMKKFMAMKPME